MLAEIGRGVFKGTKDLSEADRGKIQVLVQTLGKPREELRLLAEEPEGLLVALTRIHVAGVAMLSGSKATFDVVEETQNEQGQKRLHVDVANFVGSAAIVGLPEKKARKPPTKKDTTTGGSSSVQSPPSSSVKIEEMVGKSEHDALQDKYASLAEKYASLKARAKEAEIEISDED